MNYTCAAREEAADRAADRLAAFSAPVFSAPSPARTNLTAIQEADWLAAFSVRFTPPA